MRRRQAESYRAGFAAAVRPYVRADPIHLAQNLTSVPVENAAGRRRHNPLRASEQELGIQFELEVSDLLTQGWLGNEKFLGGFREASCIDDPDEIFELPNVHCSASPASEIHAGYRLSLYAANPIHISAGRF